MQLKIVDDFREFSSLSQVIDVLHFSPLTHNFLNNVPEKFLHNNHSSLHWSLPSHQYKAVVE